MKINEDKLRQINERVSKILEARDRFKVKHGISPRCVFVDKATCQDIAISFDPLRHKTVLDLMSWFTWKGMQVITVEAEGFLGFGWQV